MKRLLTIATALIAGIAMLISSGCDSHNGAVVYPNSMTATIGGVFAFTASSSNIDARKSGTTLNIIAIADSKARIYITVPSFSGAKGTLAISDIGLPAGASLDKNGSGVLFKAAKGTITFSKVANYLEGTFSFTCSDSTKVSDGVFKIKAP